MQDCAIIYKKDMTTLEGQNSLNDSVIGKHLRGLLVEMLPCRVVKLCYCQRDPSLTYLMNLRRFFISSVFQINKTVPVM